MLLREVVLPLMILFNLNKFALARACACAMILYSMRAHVRACAQKGFIIMAYAENYGVAPNASNLAFRPGSLYNAANAGISKPLGSTWSSIIDDMMTKPYDANNYELDPYLPSNANDVPNPVHPNPSIPYGGSNPVNSAGQLDYYLADLAKHYKMDKATAYQEALSNSSYQRAVADLRAAGLNPVLAMGKVSPADSFAGSYQSTGGGGGSRRTNQSTDWVKMIGQVAKVATSAAAIMRVVGMLAV